MMAPRDEIIPASMLKDRLAALDGWHGDTSGISRTYSIGYDDAIGAVAEIGQAAVELEHRPDIDIRWDRLTVYLTTHTAGDAARGGTDCTPVRQAKRAQGHRRRERRARAGPQG